ncbi:RHS repeat-associated core domain-containing protein [Alteromonas lipotrueae]|uniref:RHS repeat-associated core domain-containing protein n=1 Tax=Alteromonas lipotrueae TaxID=2803814 RepID=UPI001C46EAD9|nr:RHS repeat-associated core domain-containing protein [Alteromonas lipotrueae]
MQIIRSISSYIIIALAFISYSVSASEGSASLYEKNGSYYVKSAPTWVPIAGTVFVIVPTYAQGDIIEVMRDGSNWVSSPISFSQFNSIAPVLIGESSFQRIDIDGNGLEDITINTANETLQFLTSDNDGYILNTAPQLASISNQAINEDTTKTINFTVSDTEQDTAISLNVLSSNPALIPASAISIGGSGTTKSLSIEPNANQSGSATITIKASDGLLTSESSFLLTVSAVNDVPTISPISNVVLNEDSSTSVTFTVNDIEKASNGLVVSASSSNASLFASNTLSVSGSSSNRSLSLAPIGNKYGYANIVVTVSDGVSTATRTFSVTVNSVNDKPTVTIAAPTHQGEYGLSIPVVARASANDIEGSVSQVEFKVNNGAWKVDTSAPYTYSFADLPEGTHSISVRAKDANNTYSSTISSSFEVLNLEWAEKGGAVSEQRFTASGIAATDFYGQTAGSANVSGGAAAYTIPIDIIPGRAGMQPTVALQYNSRSGVGIAGVGWTLNASGAIARCSATQAQDGYVGAIKFSYTNDKLCLNGQRLINVSGLYGSANTEYRLEIDNFTRVFQRSGNTDATSTYFEVKLPSGVTSYYGRSSASRVSPSGTEKNLSWLLDKTQDVSAKNHISYYYTSYGAGEKLLTSIKYTGNGSTDGTRKVEFKYQNKRKTRSSYLWGTLTKSTKRLDYVDTFYGAQRVKRYNLSYVESRTSGRDLLSDIQECGYTSGAVCKAKTTFNWSDDTPAISFEPFSFDSKAMYATEDRIANILPRGDINGDGVRDWKGFFVNAEGEKTGTTSKSLNPCHTNFYKRIVVCTEADFNLDGLTDDWRNNNGSLELKYSSKTNSTSWMNTGITLNKKILYLDFQDDHIMNIADYNGDSWPDLMVYRFEDYMNPKLWVYLHTGNNSSPYSDDPKLVYTFSSVRVGSSVSEIRQKTSVQFMGDINGDNTPDLLLVENNTGDAKYSFDFPQPKPRRFLFNSGNGYTYTESPFSYSGSGSNSSKTFFTFFTDVNGDGLSDWLGWRENPNSSTESLLVVKMNQGNGVFSDESIIEGDNFKMNRTIIFFEPGGDVEYSTPMYGNAIKIADVDGDGVAELLEPGPRLITGCALVNGINNNTRKRCGNDMYGVFKNSANTVAKIQSAERDDSIYKWNAFHFSEDTNGNISLTKKSTDYIGHAYESAFVDSHGKGLPDLVSLHKLSYSSNTFENNGSGTEMAPYFEEFGAYISRNKGAARGGEKYLPHDLLESVSAPKGISATWKYRPLSSDEYDKAGTNAQPFYETDFEYTHQLKNSEGDYLHFSSSMYVVAEFNIDNGVGAKNKHLYRYKGAVFNVKGRGFMGFREITHENTAAKILTNTTFGQMFPKTGLVETEKVMELGKTRPYNYTTNEWVETSAYSGEGTYLLHNAKQVVKTYDINNLYSTLATATTTVPQSAVDSHGNVLKSTTVQTDKFSENTVIKTAEFDSSDDWPNKLVWSTISRKISPKSTSVLYGKSNTFTKVLTSHIEQWNNTHRKPSKVVTSGGVDDLTESGCLNTSNSTPCSVSITTFNTYGLPKQQHIKGVVLTGSKNNKVIDTRSVFTTYSNDGATQSSDGYFPFKITLENGSYDHISTMHHSPFFGGVTMAVDANSLTTTTKYDSLFRPKEISAPGVAKQTITYATPDNAKGSSNVLYMISTAQAGAPRTKTYFDDYGRTLRASVEGFKSGQWNITDKRYNALGLVTSESLPHNGTPINTLYKSYDVLGRLLEKTTPAVNSNEDFTTYYSHSGFTTEITTSASDGYNLRMSRENDSSGLLRQTTDALGGITRYGYDGLGNPVVIEDAARNQIVAHYDNLGRKLWVNDPNQGKTIFTYNAFGELENELDANGKYQRYDYDKLGRVKLRYSSDGGATFTWDTKKKGLLSKSTVSGASREFYYDSLARPTQVKSTIDGTSYSTITEYNADHGFAKAHIYPNGLKIALVYNSRGYLTAEKNAANNYVYREITEQDSLGNIKKANIANAKQNGEYIYSQRTGQMLVSLVKASGATVHYLDYTNYDSYGNLRSQVNRVGSTPQVDTYTYDKLHRLERSSIKVGSATTHVDYAYDAVGNLKKKTDYTVNSGNAYTYYANTNKVKSVALKAGGSNTFSHDNKGNLIKRNNVTEFTYNVMNKPTIINRMGAKVTLSYDADWTRYKQVRTVNGKNIVTHYVSSLFEVEKEDSKTTETSYISDVAVIVESNSEKKIRFTHKDRLGSSTTLIDHNSNIIAYRYFDPFGKPRMGDGSLMQSFGKFARLGSNLLDVDMATRRGFTDHEHLDEVEIIHMNGRVYDYNLGRFLSVDPFVHGGSQGINPYSYIMNNPLSGTDPTGYAPEDEVKKTVTVTKTGSRIKHKVEVSASSNGSGGVTVTFSGSNGAAVNTVKNSVSNALSGAGFNVSDIGSQQSLSKSDSNFGNVGGINNDEDLNAAYQSSVEKYGAEAGSVDLGDDQSFNYNVSGSEGFSDKVAGYLGELKDNEFGLELLQGLASSGTSINIFENIGKSAATSRGHGDIFSWTGTTIAFDPNSLKSPVSFENMRGRSISHRMRPKYVLAHELFHAWQNASYFSQAPNIGQRVQGENGWEVNAVRFTNQIRRADNMPFVRTQYSIGGPRVDSFESVRGRTR